MSEMDRKEQIKNMIRAGYTARQIEKSLGCSATTVMKIRNRMHIIDFPVSIDEITQAITQLSRCRKLKNKAINGVLQWLIDLKETHELRNGSLDIESESDHPTQADQEPQD